MNRLFPLSFVIPVILVSSCMTLNQAEIRNLDRVRFEPLRLSPSLESNNLRLDLIRESYENRVNDSTVTTEDTPYHPLGFDLGNGLFFDLNDNLSLRLDELLGVTDADCWSVTKTSRRKQWWADCIWTNCHDSLTITYPPGRRLRYVNHREYNGSTVSVMHRRRLNYAVDFGDPNTVYRYKKRKLDTLRKTDENQYVIREGFRHDVYRLQENRLILKRKYIIEITDNNRKISIIQPGLFRSRMIMNLEKSNDWLFIYDRKFHGRKIEFTADGIMVYRDRTFQSGWHIKRKI